MKYEGHIISCFSGVGKTHFVLNNNELIDCIDLDFYDWMHRGNLGPNWSDKYFSRINQCKNKFDITFVNTTPDILNYLEENFLKETTLIYPYRYLKDEWVERVHKRGGESNFYKILENIWDEWITSCENWKGLKYKLKSGEYLTDVPFKYFMKGEIK
jgi:hypothetical protein